jgi:hypothetical protein
MNQVRPAQCDAPGAREVVELGARQLGLALDAAALDRVALQWERLRLVVAELDTLPLEPHDQPAPEFVPGAEAAP